MPLDFKYRTGNMPICTIMINDYKLFIVFVEFKVFRIVEIITFQLVSVTCISFCLS